MTDEENKPSRFFMAHPEITAFFESSFRPLVAESDRGAVLVGASHINSHLDSLFRSVAPTGMGKEKLRHLLDYPGPLSTFSAKTEVAVLCRFIPEELGQSIRHFKSIRNKVTH